LVGHSTMSAYADRTWRESEDLPRITHRREPPGGDMQRRGESGQSVKGQRQGAQPKVRKTPTAHVSTDHSAAQFDCLKRERDEAREQQAATAEILCMIRASPADGNPCLTPFGAELRWRSLRQGPAVISFRRVQSLFSARRASQCHRLEAARIRQSLARQARG